MSELRYLRNQSLISEQEQNLLAQKTAAIVGCGGLGGHIAEQFSRLGVARLILIDEDCIEPTNLNRQLMATEQTLGLPKTRAARLRISQVNPATQCVCHQTRLNKENAAALLEGAQIVMDAVDNIETRFVLEQACCELDIPLVHGAIGGWYGQVGFIQPGDRLFSKLYPAGIESGVETRLGTPAFTPALVASLQVAEALKYFLGKGPLLRNCVLRLDTLSHEYHTIDL